MKRLKYIVLAIIASTFVLQSCSEDKMDEINENKNNPEFVASRYLIANVATSTSFSVVGSDLAFYTAIYTELLAGVDNQMFRAQTRNGEPQLASTYNNKWNDTYSQLKALKTVIEQCSPGGKEAGNNQALGIAQVLSAYNWAILTDLFGDIPMKEALQPGVIYQPKIDKQEDVYKEIFRLLDEGIANLQKSSGQHTLVGTQDIIYKGSNTNWVKAAYGLKARYTMRLSYRKADYQAVLDYVDKSFVVASEEMKVKNSGIPYPFYQFEKDRGGLASSKSFYDLMKTNDATDPRLVDFFVPLKNAQTNTSTLVLFDQTESKPNEGKGIYSPSGLSFLTDEDKINVENPIFLLSYHELLFLKAEAEARLGKTGEALVTLEQAVKAGLTKAQRYKYPTYKPTIDAGLSGNALIKKIAQEKYISFFEVESIEAYNDIRRWKAMGEENIPLKNPKEFPYRLGYGQSDVVSNENIKTAFGNGSYVYSENVWWAGGTR
ncbi:MAG: SusD/RagB family nutrient-binding outer membrane lipoprotein [Flavobacteriaceae bacterium]|jgi:hypothetical protein|nr:SusD/RagB family nutrient-binding outer membrane lipoprotein [Flavobacteriaceae bacterium]